MSAATTPSLGSPIEDAFDRPRRMIGQWRLGRTIGKGSSGRVKIARHSITKKLAAVKIIPKRNPAPAQNTDDEDRLARSIEREIVIMKLIDHPHVLKLYDVWETSSQLYLILEYIEGGELFEHIVQKGRLDLGEALRYFQQIIHAVHYCHCFNIAHRDLKPENILLDRDRNVKIADFGMAVWEGTAGMLETSCGSPHYASPEILNGKRYSGASADVWSCGVILYALVTGSLPFHDEKIETLLRKVRLGQYDMPKDIPEQAQDLIARMLQKDVTKRIAIPNILQHPFFCVLPMKEPRGYCNAKALKKAYVEPISKVEDVDSEIFANLRILWPKLSDKTLLRKLQAEKKTWQKAVYHLLCNYRNRELEGCSTPTRANVMKDFSFARPARPTPKQARQSLIPTPSAKLDEFVMVEGDMQAKFHPMLPAPTGGVERPVTNGPALEQNQPAVADPYHIPVTQLSPITEEAVLDDNDEGGQRFFQQVVKRLDFVQGMPELAYPEAHYLTKSAPNPGHSTENQGKALSNLHIPNGKSGRSRIKENIRFFPDPSREGGRPRLQRRVLQDETNLDKHQVGQARGLVVNSVGRKFIDVVRLKKASFVLLSTKDLGATERECARLLRNLEVLVRTVRGDLKCVFPQQGPMILQFRIRMAAASKADTAAGYPTSMTLTLDKGELSPFRVICDELRQVWYYDVLPEPASILESR